MTRRWIPNVLTVINLFAGLVAIMLAFAGQWALAVALIFGAALSDSLEARVARRLNVASEFGKQLDSFADLVSFGVAPSIVAYLVNFGAYGIFNRCKPFVVYYQQFYFIYCKLRVIGIEFIV